MFNASSLLSALIGQQLPSTVSPEVNYDEDGNVSELLLTGVRSSPAPETPTIEQQAPRVRPNIQPGYYDNMLLGNNEAILRRDQASVEAGEVARARKGLFGAKGTLRDVLGLVGDAFLVQGGGQAIYGPQREQEKIADAMAGMTAGPAARRAAIERVARINPSLAEEMQKQYDTDMYRQTMAESQSQRRATMNDSDRARRVNRARPNVAAILNTPGAIVDGKIAQWAKNAVSGIVQGEGIELADVDFFDDMTEQELRDYAKGAGMSVRQQEQTRQGDAAQAVRERNAATAEKNAQSNRIRANRPPAGRQPRAETADERYTRISNTPQEKRSTGDQDWYETERQIRIRQGQPSGRSGRPPIPGAPAQTTSATTGRFRPANRN